MKLRDCDGDIWESDGEGGWELLGDDNHGYFPDRETLDIIWGPLSEVED